MFPTDKKLINLAAAGSAPGSHVKTMRIGGAGWVEGNQDIDLLQAKPGSDVILSSTPEKKKLMLVNLGTKVEKMDLQTNQKTGKGTNTWVQG